MLTTQLIPFRSGSLRYSSRKRRGSFEVVSLSVCFGSIEIQDKVSNTFMRNIEVTDGTF